MCRVFRLTNVWACIVIVLLLAWCGCNGEIHGKRPHISTSPSVASSGRWPKPKKEYSINNVQASNDGSLSNIKSMTTEREQLYEAYNLLHSLAQVGSLHPPSSQCCFELLLTH